MERSYGVITDVDFVEGIIEGMKSLGIPGNQFYIREVNGSENLTEGKYAAMGSRTGADIKVITGSVNKLSAQKIVWKDVPNYPNPFNATTRIAFSLPRDGHVRIDVLNGQGQLLSTLTNQVLSSGNHVISWSADRLPSGTYYYRLLYDGVVKTGRMMLVK